MTESRSTRVEIQEHPPDVLEHVDPEIIYHFRRRIRDARVATTPGDSARMNQPTQQLNQWITSDVSEARAIRRMARRAHADAQRKYDGHEAKAQDLLAERLRVRVQRLVDAADFGEIAAAFLLGLE